MTRLYDAIERAEARKEAVFGEAESAVSFKREDFADRAMFSGFDLDIEELALVTQNISGFFIRLHHMAGLMGMGPELQDLFGSAWVDGFIVGLMYNTDEKE